MELHHILGREDDYFSFSLKFLLEAMLKLTHVGT